MTRAVVDTSVFVSAFIGRSDGAPARLLRAARERRFADRGEQFVRAISALSTLHDDPPTPQALTRDSEDDYLVALAQTARADAIVSLDRDLLDAGLDIRCVTPAEWLALLDARI